DLDEPGIQVPGAGQEHLLLQAAPAAAFQERLRVLEVFVPGNDRPGNFAGLDRPAIQRRDNADHVRLDPLQEQVARIHAVLGGVFRIDDDEQRLVNPVSAGGEDARLASFLAAIDQEFARVLEVVAVDDFAEDAFRRYASAVGGDHQGNFALRDNRHRRFDD